MYGELIMEATQHKVTSSFYVLLLFFLQALPKE